MVQRYVSMKKLVMVTSLCMALLYANAQKDSSCKRPRLFSVQVDLSVPPFLSGKSLSQDEYRKIAPGDEYLNKDFTGYSSSGYYFFFRGFQGMPGIRVYADLGGKKWKKEVYFGLRYSKESVSGLNFSRDTDDTVGTYVDANTNKVLYQLRRTHENYNFGINAKRFLVPFGINFTTNKDRFFWFSMGLEVAPAISYNYEFVSWQQISYEEKIVEPGQGFNFGEGYTNYSSMNTGMGNLSTRKISGTTFGVYVSTPLAVYLHPFKRVRFLKNLHPMVSLSPTFGYANYKYAKQAMGFGVNAAAGLRVIW
jgi:hypothetical protein